MAIEAVSRDREIEGGEEVEGTISLLYSSPTITEQLGEACKRP